MTKKKNPLVFLDVSIDGDPVEKIVIEVIDAWISLLFVIIIFFLFLEFFQFLLIVNQIYLLHLSLDNHVSFEMCSFLQMLFLRQQRILGHSVQVSCCESDSTVIANIYP